MTGLTPDRPSLRLSGTARVRAAISAVRLEVIPPLVNVPPATGNPTNSPIQRKACCSTRNAAADSAAMLTSCEAANASASTADSRPEDPM